MRPWIGTVVGMETVCVRELKFTAMSIASVLLSAWKLR